MMTCRNCEFVAPWFLPKYNGCCSDICSDAADLQDEVSRLRRALLCETCHGEGFVGYHDQQDPCPGCIDVRRTLPGGRWFGVGA